MHYSLLVLFSSALVAAEDGLKAWLRYAPLPPDQHVPVLPSRIVALNQSVVSPVYTAAQEIHQGVLSILGKQLDLLEIPEDGSSTVVVGTVKQYAAVYGNDPLDAHLSDDGFRLIVKGDTVRILGSNERGALYGAFEYLSMVAQGNFSSVDYVTNPSAPIRWTNEWDNMDDSGTHGIIERGYAGKSIFFENRSIVANLTRAAEYARLLASIRVNAVVVNNVNANYTTLLPENIEGLGRIADVFRPYGVQLGLSLYFASPANLTNLTTYDPLDSRVIDWWTDKTNEIYRRIPDMAGYLVKANSEGQPGPIHYNRTLAQGANMFARALKPHGGVLMFRAFVYDQLNQTDWNADRANAAVDYFQPLDGEFDDNVVVQIKYGPIDFQVREPVSPLFANLRSTSTAIELQVTQGNLGQQCHLVYLPPLWKTITDFDLRVDNESSYARDIMTGKHFNRTLGGSAAVVNVGSNSTWLGSHLAMSNLYAYGRLAWDWTLDPVDILQDWICLTFGFDEHVLETLVRMSMDCWPAYENYTGNLGVQTLTDILYTHYGPNAASQDNNGWGQLTRADSDSIGMDRTVWNGTGFAGQYPPQVAEQYENIETTPEELLLWFHHLPYTHVLSSWNKSIIQHYYDAHYAGAETAQNFVTQLKSLKGLIDDERYEHMLFRQIYQAGHAIVWRDAIVDWIHALSGVGDIHGRVGNHPYRIEAESMQLDNYILYNVDPPGMVSNATAIVMAANGTRGSKELMLLCEDGVYDVAVNYLDLLGGQSFFVLTIEDRGVAKWSADYVDTGALGHSASIYLDGHSATRITFENVNIKKGDILRILAQADGIEPAPLDYISILPKGVVD